MKRLHKFLILGLSTVLMTVSCTDNFEDINTNPNQPDRIADPSLLLPEIIWELADSNWDNSFDRGSIVADQVSNLFTGSFNDWTRSDANRFGWEFYAKLKDIDFMIGSAEEQGLENYRAIGLILKSWAFQNITDNFGPIPYSEAGKAREDVNFPKYDSQEAIYAGILADLETANALLGSTTEVVVGDILYDGDVQNWKKFANGLRLRMLLRQSDRKDPSAEMQKIVGNPSANPLFTSHEDQAALQYLTETNTAHPAFRGNVSDWSSSSSTRLCTTMELILKGMNDPRIAAFALPTSASAGTGTPEYGGVPNGIIDPSQHAGGVLHHSLIGLLWAPRQYDETLVSPNAPQSVFMPYSEVQFILAEARERGFISIGDAATYYNNGISDQFTYYSSRIPGTWSLPTAAQMIPSPSYYTQDAVAYTGTQAEKLEKIYTQKWLSLFMVGFEAWSEWRRVGVPFIEAGPATSGFIPTRYVYPADEQRLNEESYQAGVGLLGGPDAINTRVWWDVADN
jgi:SusD/RagB-like outer membrane lipoprotein